MSVSGGFVHASQNASNSISNTSIGDLGRLPGQIDMTWVVSDAALDACAVAMVISCVACAVDMWQHVGWFNHPKLQSGTVRILFMIPVYSVLSYITLVFPPSRFLLRTIRDTYEAFVLYQFLALLIEYCGGEAQLIQSLERKKYKGVHPFPMCFLPMFNLDRAFYFRCKRWVLQYALIKPLCAVIAMVTHPFGIYDETNLDFSWNVFAWVFLVNNISITWSLWYLVVFHNEVERELHYCRPLLKFICIKSIIFFSYWQSSALGIMLSIGMVYTGDTAQEREEVGGCIQEFLICLELVPIAVLHHFGFGVAKLQEEMKEHPLYETASNVRRSESRLARLDEALSLGQFFRDTVETVFAKTNQLRHGIDDEPVTKPDKADATKTSRQKHQIFSRIAWPQHANLISARVDPSTERKDGNDDPNAQTLALADVTVVTVESVEDRSELASAAQTRRRRRYRQPSMYDHPDDDDDLHDDDERGGDAVSDAASKSHIAAGARSTASAALQRSVTFSLPPTNTMPTSVRQAPIPLEVAGTGAFRVSEAALELCTAVAASHGTAPTTGEVFHAAAALEKQHRRGTAAGRAAAAAGGAAGEALQAEALQAMYDWSSSSDEDSEELNSNDGEEEQNEAAWKQALRFGLKAADNLKFITTAATTANRAMQRVLFDEGGPTIAKFCVVCGRSDREMIQRKSGLKCVECKGKKHNYQKGEGLTGEGADEE
jgi:hypothetical protein